MYYILTYIYLLFETIKYLVLGSVGDLYLLVKYYSNGMATYCKRNNVKKCKGMFNKESELDTVRAEFLELCEAIYELSPIDIFLEFFDVLHSLIKLVIVNIFPEWVYCNNIIWIFVFPVVFPVSAKLAIRNYQNGCIRNHKNLNNINHNCIHSDK